MNEGITRDPALLWLLGGVLLILIVASAIGAVLARRTTSEATRATIDNLNARIQSWWVMCAVLALAALTGRTGAVLLFAAISFLALREFVTLTPAGQGDHRTLLWIFFIVTPIQYWLVWTGVVWPLRHLHPGLRLSARASAQRPGRGDERFPGAHGDDPVGADDLRLLRQPRPGAADAARRWRPGRRGEAAALPDHRGAEQRRAAVRLGQALRAASYRAERQPAQDLGRIRRGASPAPRCSAPPSGG